jgi:hypothetical protein
MAHISKGKVSFSVLKPKTIDFSKYKDEPYKLGVLVGNATSVKTKTDDRNDAEYTMLIGAFQMFIGNDVHPLKPETMTSSVSSGVCYMPDAWMAPIIDTLKGAGDLGPGAGVKFVLEISIGRRGEQDYEWIVRDLQPPKQDNVLATILAGAGEALAVEDQSAGKKGKAA